MHACAVEQTVNTDDWMSCTPLEFNAHMSKILHSVRPITYGRADLIFNVGLPGTQEPVPAQKTFYIYMVGTTQNNF